MVIMDNGLYVKKSLVELRKKGLFGAALIKNHRYWPENIKGDAINDHFASKEVGNVDAVKKVEDGVAYHVFFMKDPDYVMKIMTTYETLEKQNKFKRGGVMEKKEFMDTEVVANHFLYRHYVDDNINRSHAPISIERTWATKYWRDCCFAWYLAVPEVNMNYA